MIRTRSILAVVAAGVIFTGCGRGGEGRGAARGVPAPKMSTNFAPAKLTWDELLADHRARVQMIRSRDCSAYKIAPPLTKLWSFQDVGATSDLGRTDRDMHFLGCDGKAAYGGGLGGRLYKINLKTGDAVWTAGLPGMATRGMLLGPHLVLRVQVPPSWPKGKTFNPYAIVSTATGSVISYPYIRTKSTDPVKVNLGPYIKPPTGSSVGSGRTGIPALPAFLGNYQSWLAGRGKAPLIGTDPRQWTGGFLYRLFAEESKALVPDADGSFYRSCRYTPPKTAILKYSRGGAVVWRKDGDACVIRATGVDDLVTIGGATVRRIAKSDGSELWSRQCHIDGSIGGQTVTAFIFGDRVAVSAKNLGDGGPADTSKPKNRTLLWLDRKTGARVGYTRFDGEGSDDIRPAPGHIFVTAGYGKLDCYAPAASTRP